MHPADSFAAPRRRRPAALAAAALLLLLAPAAQAAPYEPNDSLPTAAGPMVGGQPYDAAIETQNDQDHYYLYAKGQRQIDVSLSRLGGDCGGEWVELRDATDGDQLGDEGHFPSNGTTSHLTYSVGYSRQLIVSVFHNSSWDPGCQYRIRVDPADAIAQSAPGLIAFLGSLRGTDDTQRVLVDGVLKGSSTGENGTVVELGDLPASAKITFEAENKSTYHSWNVDLTNYQGRGETTIFTEQQSGGDDDSPRVGLVRRVVMSPSGGIAESCGEALAPVTCIPVDRDGDGSPLPADCDDSSTSVHPGAPEIVGNEIDENCDGTVAKRVFAGSSATLRRRGARYSGSVRSAAAACVGQRRVVLRRVGSRRALATTRSAGDGRFAFTLRRRARGRVYVVVSGRTVGLTSCRSASSRTTRG